MKRIVRGFRQIQSDLVAGENLDAYIAILLAVVFTILDLLGIVGFDVLGAAILMTLVLVVTGTLINRRALENFQDTVTSLQLNNGVISRFDAQLSVTRELLRTSRSITVTGISLYRFFPIYRYDIEEALAHGSKLRVLLVKPDYALMKMAELRSPEGEPAENEMKRINGTIDLLKSIKKRFPKADIEVKTIEYMLPYGFTLIEPQSGELTESTCLVRLQSFKTTVFKTMVITPHPVRSKELFDYFGEQFANMWEVAGYVDGLQPAEPDAEKSDASTV